MKEDQKERKKERKKYEEEKRKKEMRGKTLCSHHDESPVDCMVFHCQRL